MSLSFSYVMMEHAQLKRVLYKYNEGTNYETNCADMKIAASNCCSGPRVGIQKTLHVVFWPETIVQLQCHSPRHCNQAIVPKHKVKRLPFCS